MESSRHIYAGSLLFFFLLLSLSLSSVSCATIIFDNSTMICGNSSSPCTLSNPDVWIDKKAPSSGDDVVVYAEGVFHFEVAERMEMRTLYFKSGGVLVITDKGEIIADAVMENGNVSVLISADVQTEGRIVTNGSLVFQGQFNASGGANIEVGTTWSDIPIDVIHTRNSSITLKDYVTASALTVVFSEQTITSLFNVAELWMQGTNGHIRDLSLYDESFLEVAYSESEPGESNITLSGTTVVDDEAWVRADRVVLDGSIIILANAEVNDLIYRRGSYVDVSHGTFVIDSIYPQDGAEMGEQNMLDFGIVSGHVDIKGSPLNAVNYINFAISNADFNIRNINLTHCHIRATHSNIQGFSMVEFPLVFEMDEMTTFAGTDVVFSRSFETKAKLQILSGVTIKSESTVRFGSCEWDDEVELYIDDSALVCDGVEDPKSQFMILHVSNGGLLQLPVSSEPASIKQLVATNSSRIVGNVEAIDVNINVGSNSDKFTFEGNLTVREHIDVMYFTPMNSLVAVEGDLSIHDVMLTLNASNVQLKRGKTAQYVLFVAKHVEVRSLEVTVHNKGDMTYSVSHTNKEIYIKFTNPYDTDGHEKKVLLWVFVTALCLTVVAIVSSVIVVHLKRKQSYEPVLL